MNVILTQDVYNLGSLGDEVIVKAGYARNYLIPQGFAVPVTRQNIKQIEHQRALLNKKREEAINSAKALKAKLEALDMVFKVKAGESGKLFGSVTQKNITEAIAEKGIELDKRLVTLLAPIKTLGNYDLVVKLHSEVNASMTIKVAADELVKEPKAEAEEEAPAEQAASQEEEE
ncbi:MAG: 50S ribosomal protein L9 [bacterium]|nr:50S ribosomal protein L9 [bacterium]